MATRRRGPAAFHLPPDGGSSYSGYGDLPHTLSPVREPKNGDKTHGTQKKRSSPPSSFVVPSGDEDPRVKGKRHPETRSYFSRLRVTLFLFGINLFVILGFSYYRQQMHDIRRIPAVGAFLEQAPRILGDDYVVIVSASTSHANGLYVRVGRSNQTAIAALHDATRQLPLHKVFKWFKLDAVTGIRRLEGFDYQKAFSSKHGDWFGVAFDGWKDHKVVFLPDQVRAHTLVDREGYLRWDRILHYLQQQRFGKTVKRVVPDYGDDATMLDVVDLFHTNSILVDVSLHHYIDVVNLHRGHRLFQSSDSLTPHTFRKAAIAAGEYLTRDISEEDGAMVSYYQPRSHYIEVSKSSSDFWNGHSASILALSKLHTVWHDSHLLVAIKSGLNFMTKRLKGCYAPFEKHQKEEIQCLISDGGEGNERFSSLSDNALLVAALAEYMDTTAGDKSYYYWTLEVADYIQGCFVDESLADEMSLKANSFVQRTEQPPPNSPKKQSTVVSDFHESYAQSQAAFALARLANVMHRFQYNHPNLSKWKETAYKAASYLVENVEPHNKKQSLEGEEPEIIPDPWLLQALSQIYRYRNLNPPLVDYVVTAGHTTSKYQHQNPLPEPDRRDLWGSLQHDSTATSTAALSQGLCSAYPVLLDTRSKAEATELLATVCLMAMYQLQWQYRPETAMYFRDPQRILGGMHGGPENVDLTNIDQLHNILSFLCVADALQHQNAQIRRFGTGVKFGKVAS